MKRIDWRGPGAITGQAREKTCTRREMTLMVLFLAACHAMVQDTVIFIPLGMDVLPQLFIRIAGAVLLTLTLAWLWPPAHRVGRQPAAGGESA